MELELEYNPYEGLTNAIIAQAAKDYEKDLIQLKKAKGENTREEILSDIIKIENFFRSDWYKVLTTVDAEYIMTRIKEQVGA